MRRSDESEVNAGLNATLGLENEGREADHGVTLLQGTLYLASRNRSRNITKVKSSEYPSITDNSRS